MAASAVETFYELHRSLYQFLLDKDQPTFAVEHNNNFRRSLALAIGSSFEHEITGVIAEVPRVHASGNYIIQGMIDRKFIPRQYHTYFDWEGSNANSFFSLFGSEFSEACKAAVNSDADLEQAIRDFLALGSMRNRLVHKNYVTFDVDRTPEEIIALYRSASRFLAFLRTKLLGEPAVEPSSAPVT